MKLQRERNAKGNPIGNIRVRLPGGRRINLETANPAEAARRAQAAKDGDFSWRKRSPTENRAPPAAAPAPPPGPAASDPPAAGRDQVAPAGGGGAGVSDGAGGAPPPPGEIPRDARDPLELAQEAAAAGAAAGAAPATPLGAAAAAAAAVDVEAKAREMAEGAVLVGTVGSKVVAEKKKHIRGGDLTPPQHEFAVGFMMPQCRKWALAGKEPPAWAMMCVGFFVIYKCVVANGTPLPPEPRRPMEPGDGFAPAG